MDILDKAQKLEALQNKNAIKKHQEQREQEPEQWIENGIVRCIDCGEEVGEKRLAAKPNAARCIYCQTYHEKR